MGYKVKRQLDYVTMAWSDMWKYNTQGFFLNIKYLYYIIAIFIVFHFYL